MPSSGAMGVSLTLSMDMESMFYMAQELLAMMSADRRVTKWLAHRGVLYERVAAQFNKRKNQPK